MLNEKILELTKKRSQLKMAVAKMVGECCTFLDSTPDKPTLLKLIDTLRTVTTGQLQQQEHVKGVIANKRKGVQNEPELNFIIISASKNFNFLTMLSPGYPIPMGSLKNVSQFGPAYFSQL